MDLSKLKPPAFTPFIQDATLADGITQSELSLKDQCALKWNFKYNNRLERNDHFIWHFWIGAAWHEFQQVWRESKGNCDVTKFTPPTAIPITPEIQALPGFEETFIYWEVILPAYQTAYAKLYKEEATHDWTLIEKELTGNLLDFKIRGRLDLMSEQFRFIRDFKSTGSAWLIAPDGWHFKLQFMLYCWLVRQNYPEFTKKEFDFQLDIMQKPNLKQTKADGTWAGHIRRVAKDVLDRPDFYLTRKSEKIQPGAISRFEDWTLIPKLQLLALARDNPNETQAIMTNPNTNACNDFGGRCEFYEICEKGWDAGKFFFHRRDVKHQEL